jgi:hypothetical protein
MLLLYYNQQPVTVSEKHSAIAYLISYYVVRNDRSGTCDWEMT